MASSEDDRTVMQGTGRTITYRDHTGKLVTRETWYHRQPDSTDRRNRRDCRAILAAARRGRHDW